MAAERVGRGVFDAEIRLGFDDDPAEAPAVAIAHQPFSQKLAGDFDRRSLIKAARQFLSHHDNPLTGF